MSTLRPRLVCFRRWRQLWPLLAPLIVAILAALAPAAARAQDLGPGPDTFSMPVSYSMPAPAAYTSASRPSSSAAAVPAPAKKSVILHHFKSMRGSTSTTPRAEEDSTAAPPRYSSSYSSQRVHGQTTSPAPSQPVPNAVSIEEAVAAAAAVTQTPELPPLTPEEAQRIFLQQQELQQQQQQQQHLLSQQQQQQQQQQPTTAQYERYYEAAAATGVTPNPYLSPTHLYTTPALGVGGVPGTPVRGAVLPHYKQGVPASLAVGAGGSVPAAAAASPVMQAAVSYYRNGYYADPALLYQLHKTPYRRVSGPAPRPRPRPRPRPHAHAHAHHPHPHVHAVPFTRYKASSGAQPQVQHFFHGPYTMEAALGGAGAAAAAGAAPDAWIEHAIAPIKRDDSLLSSLGSAPGSSTALLNGLIVPIVLLGLSIPALGFAYSYLSRRRAFNDDVTSFVQNLRPDEETIDYYFNLLQTSIECFSDPKLNHCE
ncbi:Mediator of RNA polymerase II transcription subunit 12 [Frankliniella fusca]|uniref:Mediator of RNA polymerase II transcription subunit 12 n=1 Tax=Frankliniella fusca TaxID=407009 RepID=A0AAE1HYQ3_9NEOP|nr:Mediator of RNA polymerase II transcription subunit 12 [Frankliniella fusca]